MEKPRVAWLLTSAFYYWHPMLSSLAKRFPQMKAFAANWRGYAPGFEDTFAVEVVGQRKIIPIKKATTDYGYSFTYLPLNIVNRLLQFKPDVVFSNSFGMWTLIALMLKAIGRWRVVIAYEGSSPSVDYRNSPLRLSLRRAMVKAADACITNSQAGKSYLTEVLDADSSHVFVQPYEVPAAESLLGTEITQSATSDLQHPVFIFVGGITARKGVNLLLEACAQLQQQGCKSYTLLLVGDGEQREELEAFTQQQGLGDRVRWIGRVDYGQVGTYFRQADVFVFPTLEDTWGMVLLEAMVLGKPVLCSKRAGASELVMEGENGFLFDPYDAQALATALRRFIDDPTLSQVMGQKAEQMMAQYSPEAAAKFLTEVTSFVRAGQSKL